jgi:hypothetical protein
MGFYIELPEHLNKALQLKRDHEAQYVQRPASLAEVPVDKTLVCVVENGMFDAAGIVYSDEELAAFAHFDGRRKTWLLVSTTEVLKLSPHLKQFLCEDGRWDMR